MFSTKPLIAAVAIAFLLGPPVAQAQVPADSADAGQTGGAVNPLATGGAAFGDVGPTGLEVKPGALLGGTLELSGHLASAAGQRVRIERLDAATGDWLPIARATANPSGDFTAEWETDALGDHSLRAMPDRDGAPQAQAAAASAEAVTARTTVYRPAHATWYGPGFYGHRTACGQRLRATTLGVAHKRLPCGTRVTIFLDGQTVVVPVIDRGPFTNGAAWDLTKAAADRIGMTQSARIGWARSTPAA
jgi:rare lipoprotein A